MVGPSISDEDRERFLVRLRVGFSLFVGCSMGLIVMTSDAGLPTLGGAVVGGTAVGALLAWWVIPDSFGMGPRGK